METYPYFIIGLIGLMIGSFLNVVIYRVPLGQSLWFPGSHCPACGHAIRWYHNIPLWGYLIQKGRCEHCSTKISLVYPLIETGSALILCFMYGQFGYGILFYKISFVTLMMLTIARIDYEYHIIPDRIILFGFPFAFLFTGLEGKYQLIDGAIGFLAGGLGMFIIAIIGRLFYKKDAMGGGDIKLAALLGVFLGWKVLILTLFVSFLLMTVIGWIGIAIRKVQRGSEIPMAPFMMVSVLLCIFYGHEMIHWYFDLVIGH
ncbi:prepilin peptidase [bacterium]|nr:prepilin peptidase [bacterium]